jgi:hypothetical protein
MNATTCAFFGPCSATSIFSGLLHQTSKPFVRGLGSKVGHALLWLAKTPLPIIPAPRTRDGHGLLLLSGEKPSAQAPEFPLGVVTDYRYDGGYYYGQYLSYQIEASSRERDIRHGSPLLCDHHKRKEKEPSLLQAINLCPLSTPAVSSPLWSVALSVPAGSHLPCLAFRPSVYNSLSPLPCAPMT